MTQKTKQNHFSGMLDFLSRKRRLVGKKGKISRRNVFARGGLGRNSILD